VKKNDKPFPSYKVHNMMLISISLVFSQLTTTTGLVQHVLCLFFTATDCIYPQKHGQSEFT